MSDIMPGTLSTQQCEANVSFRYLRGENLALRVLFLNSVILNGGAGLYVWRCPQDKILLALRPPPWTMSTPVTLLKAYISCVCNQGQKCQRSMSDSQQYLLTTWNLLLENIEASSYRVSLESKCCLFNIISALMYLLDVWVGWFT